MGTKILEPKIINKRVYPVNLTEYGLKIQVTDVSNARGEQRWGNINISSQGKGVAIIENFISGPEGIITSPPAISDSHVERFKPSTPQRD